jgi:hypothetical protein
MKIVRDYKAEYARRIARGVARGIPRVQARGHARPTATSIYDRTLESGLHRMREGKSLVQAAKEIHVSPERLRRYVEQTGAAAKSKRKWILLEDRRVRSVPLYSQSAFLVVMVEGFERASLAERYMASVGRFLDTNNLTHLRPFVGHGVADVNGKWHPFETQPNILYRLNANVTEPFEQLYRIVV